MILFHGMSQTEADAYRLGAPDAYGQTPERKCSDGAGSPCRCCLHDIPEGAEMLVLAHRPFKTLHPYAETGPVFLCAETCNAYKGVLPPVLTTSPNYLLKGYTADERILYGTGQTTPKDEIESYAQALLTRAEIPFVDIRSARNNCWQVRARRGKSG